MTRRWSFLVLSGATALALLSAAACSDDKTPAAAPGPADSSGHDVAFGGNDGPASDGSTDFGPGDPCGDTAGFSSAALWAMRGVCSTRAGTTTLKGPTSAELAFHTAAKIGSSSVAIDAQGTVWVGSDEGDILGFGATGKLLWTYPTGGALHSSPAIAASGSVVIGSEDGKLYGVEAGDPAQANEAGIPLARLDFAVEIGATDSSPVLGGDGTIYIGTNAGKLSAIDQNGTHVVWSVSTGDTGSSSPAIGQDGTIYLGSADHHLYAIAPGGAQKWAFDLGAEVHGSVAVGGEGTIYAGTSDGMLHAVAKDGTQRWVTAVGGDLQGAPAVFAASVFVGSTDKKLHALSTLDGKERWTYATLGAVATPVISANGVFFGSTDGRVYTVNTIGRLLQSTVVKGKVTSVPAITSASLYVATDTGLADISP